MPDCRCVVDSEIYVGGGAPVTPASYLKFAETLNQELQQLSTHKENANNKLDLAKFDVAELQGNIQGNVSVELLDGKRLTIVPEQFFTEDEQRNMAERLVESRLRTVELTYEISQKILIQSADVTQRYTKGKNARLRNVKIDGLLGGLKAHGDTARDRYEEARETIGEPTIATDVGEPTRETDDAPF
jgi:hypothetical protein